jgi:predicted nucleic acid-binding protein
MVYKVFADTNVYLDFFLQRGTDWQQIEQLFRLAEQKEIELFTSASNLLNMMYVMANFKLPKSDIVHYASAILQYTSLANPDNFTFSTALASGFRDLEDAVQYFTALSIEGIDYFITSNLKDYKAASHLKVLTAKQFLKIYERE